MTYLEVFFFVQFLDFLTTLVGLRIGRTELSPFIRWLMHLGPVAGLAAAKMVGFALGAYCVYTRRRNVLVWSNYLFAGLVIWNLYNILKAVTLLSAA